MTNLQGLLSHVHILIFSKSNLKLKVFRIFSRFLPSSIIKTSLSEEPANTMSIHRVGNVGKLVILFHPCQKMLHLPYILTISFRQRLLLLTHMLSAITHR